MTNTLPPKSDDFVRANFAPTNAIVQTPKKATSTQPLTFFEPSFFALGKLSNTVFFHRIPF